MSGETNPVMPLPSSLNTSEAVEKSPELTLAEEKLDEAVDAFAAAAAEFQNAGGNPMDVLMKFQARMAG